MTGVALFVALVAVLSLPRVVAETSSSFRPPMTPIVTFAPMHQIFVLANTTSAQPTAADRAGKYWDDSPMGINVMVRFQLSNASVYTFQLLGENEFSGMAPFAEQSTQATVDPLITSIPFLVPSLPGISKGPIGVTCSFVHLKFPDRLNLVSWPLVFLEVSVDEDVLASGTEVSVYVDMNAYNVMHLRSDEAVSWSVGTLNVSNANSSLQHAAKFARMGTTRQPVLESFGDDFMMDWGYLYVSTDGAPSQVQSATCANVSVSRSGFASGASTLPPVDPSQPRIPSDGYPVVSAMTTWIVDTTGSAAKGCFAIGYDEQGLQYYFGDVMHGRWRREAAEFVDLLSSHALPQMQTLISDARVFDANMIATMTTKVSEHYARVAALAFRQAFAAIELSHSDRFNEDWAFLKEISSDGDINTMDVIFPASPLFLYAAPEIVKQLLLPVLHYAVNDTWHPYTYPFSPHQLGVYPVANITTIEQEVMPAENTGNMFLLLLGYLQTNNFTDTDWVYLSYWPVLTRWAMYMVETQLPVPPTQICTDDFAGPLNQNTNLAAKCVVALEAYAELCDAFAAKYADNASVPQPEEGWHCDVFHNLAASYSEFWTAFAIEYDPVLQRNHSKLAFDLPNTWSTKYNLVWQKLLGLQRPFATFADIARNEVAYYRAKSNEYGFPMDIRHTYQKLDWMTWGSCLSDNVTEFADMFEGIYRMANDTTSRWPLTDLYDTVTADIVLMFRSRPVVGAVFAAMMLY